MKNSIKPPLGLAFLALIAFSCQTIQEESPVMNRIAEDNTTATASDSDANARKGKAVEFGAFLTGTEEVPAVVATGSGATSVVQVDANTLKIVLRVTNLANITAAHFHKAPAGTNGGVVVNLLNNLSVTNLPNGFIAEGTIDSSDLSGVLAGETISDLLWEMGEGMIYVNVHTTTNPGGAIRGQVSKIEPNDNKNYGAKLAGENEVPAVSSKGAGVAKFNFSNDGSSLSFQVNVAGLENVRFAHIHFAKAGANGGVVFTLRMDKVEGPVSGVYAKGGIDPTNFSGLLLGGDLMILREAFRTGNAYVNVHTDMVPSGELRGQVH
ncbi:hypothetical protein GCM10009119_37100 [Algoriphagus jejuensis]|uniref:CHRD domain-containing protein n=1 Tax=Algoriphagus jejuensis TaxID=419934 RepID=A0ABP3YK05_9BACT